MGGNQSQMVVLDNIMYSKANLWGNGVSLVGSGVYLGFGVIGVLGNGVSLDDLPTHVLGTGSGVGIRRPSWNLM